MIGRLSGVIVHKQPPWLMVEVGGVGYELEAPMTTFYELPAVGRSVTLHTHFLVREDAQLLYGFLHLAERDLFRTLIRVSGVGPKVALAILSTFSAGEFEGCVRSGDVRALTRVPGIGKKTAERLLVELRDRLQHAPAPPPARAVGAGADMAPPEDPVQEARVALEALGYKPQEAARMVAQVATEGRSSEEIIRQALRAVARR